MPQSLCKLGAHLIFSTKGRQPCLDEQISPRVYDYMAKILLNMGCKSVTVGGHVDHIHILCNLSKSEAPMKLIEIVKKESSKFVKTLGPEFQDFHWQTGYAIFGVSDSHFDSVRHYIHRQHEHHRKESFQEELRRLLTDAGIEFDEAFLWD